EVDLGYITAKKISIYKQIANSLIKALNNAKFKQFKQQLRIVDCTNIIKGN
ncbi:MAG: hypothetical protein FE78DRAFT_148199, partial [Acidomyces sp. 'richmondensis']